MKDALELKAVKNTPSARLTASPVVVITRLMMMTQQRNSTAIPSVFHICRNAAQTDILRVAEKDVQQTTQQQVLSHPAKVTEVEAEVGMMMVAPSLTVRR